MIELGKDGEISNVFGGVSCGGNDNTSYFDNGVNGVNSVNGSVGGQDNGVNTNQDVFGNSNFGGNNSQIFRPISADKAMTKKGFWSKVKEFLFQEIDLTAPIKVELTPYQQKVEDEINEFLHQEISFKGFLEILKK